EGVVAVDHTDTREDTVVEADQAHHPVRHRTHRHHRADRERASAEVGAGGTAGEVSLQERLAIWEPQLSVGARAGLVEDLVEFAFHLASLPGVVITRLR